MISGKSGSLNGSLANRTWHKRHQLLGKKNLVGAMSGCRLIGLDQLEKASFCALKHPVSCKQSRPDPCSVDFGSETPKLRFEFCGGFWGGYFSSFFSKAKAPQKSIHQKLPRKMHPKIWSEKFPSDFFRSLLSTNRPSPAPP